jgi:hypothetical protein
MIKLDIFYTKNMSLWLDLKIILKTLPALMEQVNDSRSARRQGARPACNPSKELVAGQSGLSHEGQTGTALLS